MLVTEILKESLKLLKKEPKLFIPRFITTALYTIVLLYIARLTAEMIRLTSYLPGTNPTVDPSAVASILSGALIVLVSVVLLLFIDLLSYAMYPVMIRDYYMGAKTNLKKSFREALGAWRMILVLWVLMMVFSILLAVFVFSSQSIAQETGNNLFNIASIAVILLATLLLMIVLFFVMPVGVVEKRSILKTFSDGLSLSIKYKREVIVINIFFMFLTMTTMLIMTLSEMRFSGILALLAGLIFVFTRLFEAIIYTYISVVNPYFYMKVKT